MDKKGNEVGNDKADKPKFRGRSIAKLDPKGRLRIPTKFKEILQKHNIKTLVISRLGEYLVAYPPEEWDEVEAKALKLSQVHPEHRSFVRSFISGAEECDCDNQGRILIPPLLREDAHLDQDVMFVGMLSTLEIWNKSTYELQKERDRQNEPKVMETIAITGF
jgi:MraZ protein